MEPRCGTGKFARGVDVVFRRGQISGTPTAAGTSNFRVRVQNLVLSGEKNFSIQISPPVAINTASPMLSGMVGTAYLQMFSGSGGDTPYSWSLASGSLPGGLTLTPSGNLTGTPTSAGTANFTVRLNGYQHSSTNHHEGDDPRDRADSDDHDGFAFACCPAGNSLFSDSECDRRNIAIHVDARIGIAGGVVVVSRRADQRHADDGGCYEFHRPRYGQHLSELSRRQRLLHCR